jgi:hypothetical protein
MTELSADMSIERRMWSLFEPVHAVTYFAADALGAFEEAGLRGFWRGYFAGRCAPLGAVTAGPVIGAFYGFAPRMVTRALPDVWTRITPEAALEARRTGARRTLERALEQAAPEQAAPERALSPAADGATGYGDSAAGVSDKDIAEVAELLRTAASELQVCGRVMGAANAALPWPDEPIDVLWHAATILREHRGDGHIAALMMEQLDGCESLVWRVALRDGDGRDFYQPARGWTDEEWDAAAARLNATGWVDGEGRATEKARTAYQSIEETTDRLAAAPWERLGAEATGRCAQLLHPIAVRASRLLRHPNPIGLPSLT